MKFVCDRCHTRYSISDEKVRGKVLKIRCKTCSNIIVVREQSAIDQAAAPQPTPRTNIEVGRVAAAGGSGASAPPSAPPQTGNIEIEWFVAIKGTQHGPMPRKKVDELYRAGKLRARSYVWNEGLPKWTRMCELPHFQDLIADVEAGGAKPQPPPPPADEGGEVVDFQKAREERRKAKPGPVVDDPFNLVPDAADANSTVGTGSSSAPKESTRVFIMNAGLANRKTKHRAYGAIAVVVVAVLVTLTALDWMGSVEVPGIHALISVAAETAGIEAPVTRVEKEVAEMDDELSELEAQILKCELQKLECPNLKTTYEKKKKKKRTLVARIDPTAELTDEMFQKKGGGEASGLQRKTGEDGELATFDPARSDASKADEIANLFQNDAKKKFKPITNIETPAVSGGVGLSAEQIGSVLKDNKKSIESCIAQAMKTSTVPEGKQKLVLSIQPSGRVAQAKFDNGLVNTMQVGQCVSKRARKWRFPAFEGKPFDVEIPLVLGVRF